MPGLDTIAALRNARTRSISAENPSGAKSGGALASPGDDPHTAPGAALLGRGWKVRPCLRRLNPGESFVLADIAGPGTVRHIWMTILEKAHRWLRLEITYDDADAPSVRAPVGDFFANGLNGTAHIASEPIAVVPRGGMNSYWPMPFRRRLRIELHNDGPEPVNEVFYQITCELGDVPDDNAYLHVSWRRATTTRDHPEMTIADGIAGRGHYAGTYLVWTQLSNGWWGEGEVKFFIDGDPTDAPTICGTGTEDYFGGAWGFIRHHPNDQRPQTYTTPYLGYPQAVFGEEPESTPLVPRHALYRWHIPDPIRFERDLRVTIQALGWWPTGTYQPLTDDIAATAWYYVDRPTAAPPLPDLHDRLPR